MTPPPEQWNDGENDRAHAELSKRVDDLSGEFQIVRKLPWDLAQALERDRDRTDEAFREAERTEVRRIRDLRTYVDKRLDERPEAKASMRSFMLTLAATILVPIVVAVIGALAIVNAGGIP